MQVNVVTCHIYCPLCVIVIIVIIIMVLIVIIIMVVCIVVIRNKSFNSKACVANMTSTDGDLLMLY